MKNLDMVKLSFCRVVMFVGILFGLQGHAFGQGAPIDQILGDYQVFTSSNAPKHMDARIIVMRTSEGPADKRFNTYGLAFVSNRETGPSPKGDGMVCDDAILILGDTAITCTKVLRNPSGRVTFEETLTVGIADSPYCIALREGLKKTGNDDKIVSQKNVECDGMEKQCVCYDIDHRGDTAFAPPTQGSGTGRGN